MAEENIYRKTDSELHNCVRYVKLQKLLDTQKEVLCPAFTMGWHLLDFEKKWEDSHENRNQFITGIGKQIYENASMKQEEDLTAKKICAWEVPLLVESVKCLKNDIIDCNLRYDIFERLEEIRLKLKSEVLEIDEEKYSNYYAEIANLLKEVDVFQADIDRFKPGLDVSQMSEEFTGFEGLLQNIYNCTNFGLTAQIAYGPTDPLKEQIVDHIEKIIRESKIEHPAVKIMISAGKELEFGDGRKFVIIFCAALLNATRHILEMGICSVKELSEGYLLALNKSLEILPTLSCYEIKNYDEKEFCKGLKASMTGKFYGQELKLTELIAKACASAISENTKFDANSVKVCKIPGGDFSSLEVVPEMVFEGVMTEKREYGNLILEDKIEDISTKIFQINGAESKVLTIVLRGADEKKMDEIERTIYDGVNIFKAITRDGRLLPGAGAVEIELAEQMYLFAKTFTGVNYQIITGFGNALVELTRAVAESTGVESAQIAVNLLKAHKCGKKNVGFLIQGEGTLADVVANDIFDVYLTKYWGLKNAVNAAIKILNLNSDRPELAATPIEIAT